jgi:hypothetical protein
VAGIFDLTICARCYRMSSREGEERLGAVRPPLGMLRWILAEWPCDA